jgi:hypothetical protein
VTRSVGRPPAAHGDAEQSTATIVWPEEISGLAPRGHSMRRVRFGERYSRNPKRNNRARTTGQQTPDD